MGRATLTWLAAAVVLGLAPGVAAEEAEAEGVEEVEGEEAAPAPQLPPDRLVYTNAILARFNPLGLEDRLELIYRTRLFEGDSVLLQDNHLGVGVAAGLTPADTKLGVLLQAQPLAILKLILRWDWLGYYGSFDHVQSFRTTRLTESGAGIDPDTGEGRAYPTMGWQFTASVLLQAAVGPVAVRSQLNIAHGEMELKGDDTVWYDPRTDHIVPSGGWYFYNDADLLVRVGAHLIFGVRYTYTRSLYDAVSVEPGDPTDDGTDSHRVGPLFAYKFWSEPGTMFDNPTVIVLVNWYPKHLWRPGTSYHPAVPYVVAGFAFGGDLLSGDFP